MFKFLRKDSDKPLWFLLFGFDPRKVALFILILIILGVFGYWVYGKFRVFNSKRIAKKAVEYYKQGQYKQAIFTARVALTWDGRNVDACKVFADVAELMNSPEAILWRSHIARIETNKVEHFIAWARTALKLGDLEMAGQALSTVPTNAFGLAEYNRLVAGLALATRNYPLAELYFTKVVQLEPTNTLDQMNLASIQLVSTNLDKAAKARKVLEEFSKQPQYKLPALRALFTDALRLGHTNQAFSVISEILKDPNAEISDYLKYLDALLYYQKSKFYEVLAGYQEIASQNPASVFLLASWLNSKNLADQTIKWLLSLKDDVRNTQPVPLALAEAYIIKGNWDELEKLTGTGEWGGIQFLRLLFYARALKEKGLFRESALEWKKALLATRENPDALRMMVKILQSWGWAPELEETLWKIARSQQNQKFALRALAKIYKNTKDSKQFLKAMERLLEVDPNDSIAKHNIAILNLLLEKDKTLALRLAEENYRKTEKNPLFATAYAYALFSNGRTEEALKIMETLSESDLKIEGIGGYYGVMLNSVGQTEKAKKLIEMSLENADLFPEEKVLFTQALIPQKELSDKFQFNNKRTN